MQGVGEPSLVGGGLSTGDRIIGRLGLRLSRLQVSLVLGQIVRQIVGRLLAVKLLLQPLEGRLAGDPELRKRLAKPLEARLSPRDFLGRIRRAWPGLRTGRPKTSTRH